MYINLNANCFLLVFSSRRR